MWHGVLYVIKFLVWLVNGSKLTTIFNCFRMATTFSPTCQVKNIKTFSGWFATVSLQRIWLLFSLTWPSWRIYALRLLVPNLLGLTICTGISNLFSTYLLICELFWALTAYVNLTLARAVDNGNFMCTSYLAKLNTQLFVNQQPNCFDVSNREVVVVTNNVQFNLAKYI